MIHELYDRVPLESKDDVRIADQVGRRSFR